MLHQWPGARHSVCMRSQERADAVYYKWDPFLLGRARLCLKIIKVCAAVQLQHKLSCLPWTLRGPLALPWNVVPGAGRVSLPGASGQSRCVLDPIQKRQSFNGYSGIVYPHKYI